MATKRDEQLELLVGGKVAPMDGPVIAEGGVVIAVGKIVAVGRGDQLRHEYPRARVEDCSGLLLTPGLVNAHTHLELSDLSQGEPPKNFGEWIMGLLAQLNQRTLPLAEAVAAATRIGIAQCRRFGVTTVGDISRFCAFSRPVLRESRLRAVSFGEVQAMAGLRDALEERLAAAVDDSLRSERLTIGVTPHAPYTVEAVGYQRCLEFSRRTGGPIATHLAETLEEGEFLANQTGPFLELWERVVRKWDDRVPKFSGGPIRFARDLGLIDHPTLLAHVNYCDDQELAILAKGRASVVYCPRTHAYFGHSGHRWREMLARGINVAAGTDSCASSPDLNLMDDLRALHRIAPEVAAMELWQMGTVRGAKALGLEKEVGSLTAGKRADIAGWRAGSLEAVLENPLLPARLWAGGEEFIATDGEVKREDVKT